MRHPTKKELVTLRLLSQNTDGLYGLEIVRESAGRIGQGSVYFLLDRLEESGYIDSRSEIPPPGYGGKPRHIYSITALGQKVLNHEEQFEALQSGMTAGASRALA